MHSGIGIEIPIPECIPQFLELNSGMHSDFPKMELELECIPILQKGIGFGIDQLQFRKKKIEMLHGKNEKVIS